MSPEAALRDVIGLNSRGVCDWPVTRRPPKRPRPSNLSSSVASLPPNQVTTSVLRASSKRLPAKRSCGSLPVSAGRVSPAAVFAGRVACGSAADGQDNHSASPAAPTISIAATLVVITTLVPSAVSWGLPAMPSSCGSLSSSIQRGDHVDLDARPARERARLDRRAGRAVIAEAPAVHLVHGVEVLHVGEEHGRAHPVPEAGACFLEHRLEVLDRALGLGRAASLDDLAGLGHQPDLPRAEHEVAGLDGLRVGSDRTRGAVGLDGLSHRAGFSLVRGLSPSFARSRWSTSAGSRWRTSAPIAIDSLIRRDETYE